MWFQQGVGVIESGTTSRHSIHEEVSEFLKHESPRTLFNSFPSDDPVAKHKLWYQCIRATVWERIDLREDELHGRPYVVTGLRSCSVSHFPKYVTGTSDDIEEKELVDDNNIR